MGMIFISLPRAPGLLKSTPMRGGSYLSAGSVAPKRLRTGRVAARAESLRILGVGHVSKRNGGSISGEPLEDGGHP